MRDSGPPHPRIGAHRDVTLAGIPWRLARDSGSVLLVVLLLALGSATLVAGLTLTFRAGLFGLEAETAGRAGLASADEALAALAREAWASWGPARGRLSGAWEGELTEVPEEPAALLSAVVVPSPTTESTAGPASWGYSVGALVEVGHDGLDLPHTALVAGTVVVASDRDVPGVLLESDTQRPTTIRIGTLVDPTLLGPGITPAVLEQPWRLDAGTRALAVGEAARSDSAVVTLTDRSGGWYRLPADSRGRSPEDPILLVVAGGAGLDLRDLGDLFGVVVVDDAGLRLEGTRLHGAVMVTDAVDLGVRGQVLWSSSLYRWATDRSVRRVRLIPGSRVESLYP